MRQAIAVGLAVAFLFAVLIVIAPRVAASNQVFYLVMDDIGCDPAHIATDAGCWSTTSGGLGGDGGFPSTTDFGRADMNSGSGTGVQDGDLTLRSLLLGSDFAGSWEADGQLNLCLDTIGSNSFVGLGVLGGILNMNGFNVEGCATGTSVSVSTASPGETATLNMGSAEQGGGWITNTQGLFVTAGSGGGPSTFMQNGGIDETIGTIIADSSGGNDMAIDIYNDPVPHGNHPFDIIRANFNSDESALDIIMRAITISSQVNLILYCANGGNNCLAYPDGTLYAYRKDSITVATATIATGLVSATFASPSWNIVDNTLIEFHAFSFPIITTNFIEKVTSYSARVNITLVSVGDSASVAISSDSSPGSSQVCLSIDCGPFSTDSHTLTIADVVLIGQTAYTAWGVASYTENPGDLIEGSHLGFTTYADAVLVTDPATSITQTTAKLHGRMTAKDTTPVVSIEHLRFEYTDTFFPGTFSVYANTSASSFVAVQTITGLTASVRTNNLSTDAITGTAIQSGSAASVSGTAVVSIGTVVSPHVYFFRLVGIVTFASIPEGNHWVNASALNFSTAAPPAPPARTTYTWYFEWGDTGGLGNETVHRVTTDSTKNVAATIGPLETNKTYYFRLVVIGPDGRHNGTTENFFIPEPGTGPTVEVQGATNAVFFFAFILICILMVIGAVLARRRFGGSGI